MEEETKWGRHKKCSGLSRLHGRTKSWELRQWRRKLNGDGTNIAALHSNGMFREGLRRNIETRTESGMDGEGDDDEGHTNGLHHRRGWTEVMRANKNDQRLAIARERLILSTGRQFQPAGLGAMKQWSNRVPGHSGRVAAPHSFTVHVALGQRNPREFWNLGRVGAISLRCNPWPPLNRMGRRDKSKRNRISSSETPSDRAIPAPQCQGCPLVVRGGRILLESQGDMPKCRGDDYRSLRLRVRDANRVFGRIGLEDDPTPRG
ncbi:hypothetical protein DFH06DRAFT_1130249 [Mycena polygramma]|nr:hypothetical protein DFH06DRAFT_1130249 [Mycena polygramma]